MYWSVHRSELKLAKIASALGEFKRILNLAPFNIMSKAYSILAQSGLRALKG